MTECEEREQASSYGIITFCNKLHLKRARGHRKFSFPWHTDEKKNTQNASRPCWTFMQWRKMFIMSAPMLPCVHKKMGPGSENNFMKNLCKICVHGVINMRTFMLMLMSYLPNWIADNSTIHVWRAGCSISAFYGEHCAHIKGDNVLDNILLFILASGSIIRTL